MTASTFTYKFKKLIAPHLEEFLMDCHERELMGMDPNPAGKFAARALETRKLVYFKIHKTRRGLTKWSAFITESGKEYLNNL